MNSSHAANAALTQARDRVAESLARYERVNAKGPSGFTRADQRVHYEKVQKAYRVYNRARIALNKLES